MKESTQAVLMPLSAGKLGDRSIRQVRSAVALAQWLDADLHLLLAPEQNLSEALQIEEKLAGLIPPESRFHVEVEKEDLPEAALEWSRRHRPAMVILAIEPTHLRKRAELLPWQREVLERVEEPVLVVPSTMELRPFKSVLVPVSGETTGMSSALELGLRLGNQLRIPVDLLHVTPRSDQGGADPSLVGRLSDEFHHEYPKLVEEFVAESSPLTTVRERRILRDYLHVQGETSREIFRGIRDRERGLLIVEWKGNLARNHAETVKAILRASRFPVLLIKAAHERSSTLRMGNRLIAA
ncbi:MAG: universal stress protein [Oligoflexia bacterium]|nr:universal stress protein [Oligoflexia bacterium]